MLAIVYNFNREVCLKNATKIVGSFHIFHLTSIVCQNIKGFRKHGTNRSFPGNQNVFVHRQKDITYLKKHGFILNGCELLSKRTNKRKVIKQKF